MQADNRPDHQQWIGQWWIDNPPGSGTAGTQVFRTEADARKTCKVWVHAVQRHDRGWVRLIRQVRAVHLVETDKGSVWEKGRWRDDPEDKPLTWHHDPEPVQTRFDPETAA